jgi:hypothetical protein
MTLQIPPSVLWPVCLTLGGLAVVWAVFAYVLERRFLSRAVRASGVVEALTEKRFQRGGAMYFPVIRFTTAAGASIRVESHTTQSGIRVGQTVRILYDPRDPTNVEIDTFWSHWAMVIIASSFALILLISATAAFRGAHATMTLQIPPSVLWPVCLTLGGLAMVWAVFAYVLQRRFLRRAVRASGVVEALTEKRFQRGGAMYFPVIRFTTAAGASIRVESHTTQSGIRVGQTVRILYDPRDPTNVEIDTFWSHWAMVIIASSFALILLIMAIGAFLLAHAPGGGNVHG